MGRVLGEGGTGVVREAWDLHRRREVALKELRVAREDMRPALRREFRRAMAVRHPNLVRVYELVSNDAACFFTMELVRGHGIVASAGAPTVTADAPDAPPPVEMARALDRGARPPARDLFAQLARGLVAVHHAGLLHLDLQPGNVLVDQGGRVVLLDFGISTALRDAGLRAAFGTPGFIAPERLAGATADARSDWYSFGALLRLATDGTDEALDRLAIALTHPDPAARPGPDEILAALDPRPRRPAPTKTLVGRDDEVRALVGAVRAGLAGRSVLAVVSGPGGIGKSRLLREIEARSGTAPWLRGAFGAAEQVAFRGLTDIADDLVEQLARETRDTLAVMAPKLRQALVRVLPVLATLAGPSAPELADPGVDAITLRARTSTALVELLRGVAQRRPFVLAFEDAHLASDDVALVLADVLVADLPVPILVTTRGAGSRLDRSVDAVPPTRLRTVVRIPLGELSEDAARELLGASSARSSDAPRGEEPAGGRRGVPRVPLLIEELGAQEDASLTLSENVRRRLERLAPADRRLVRIAALGPYLRALVATTAAGEGVDIDALEEKRLVRVRGIEEEARLEPWHALIGDAVLEGMDSGRAARSAPRDRRTRSRA
ncbi:MAG: AAA family ATPase [Polyangiaceae bacterium]